MKPKRIFQVYTQHERAPNDKRTFEPYRPVWRWRCLSGLNGQIVGGSQEAFHTKANALRAARREASLLKDGFAAVEVAE